MDWPATTNQYRLNLPCVLHPVSPALAALHASRAAALHPETSAVLQRSHCLKCGMYHFSGDHPTYLVGPPTRKKRRRATSSNPQALQRKCHVCGFSVDPRFNATLGYTFTPIHLPSGSLTPKNLPTIPQQKETSDTSPPVSGRGATTIFVPPLPVRQPHPKSGNTQASTLRDMLSRDRQREIVKAHKKREEGHDGLAAFLKEL